MYLSAVTLGNFAVTSYVGTSCNERIVSMAILAQMTCPSLPPGTLNPRLLADLTVSIRPGTNYQIEIHFAVVNHLYLLFSFVNLVET